MNRRLLKFKIGSDGGVLVRYQIEHQDETTDTITLESTDIPSKELSDALQQMAKHLITIAEFPVPWRKDIKVLGVTVTHTNGVQGLVITATRELLNSNAPLIINTPHFTREPYSETSESDVGGVFSSACATDLDELERLALAFADGGERLQKELQFEAAVGRG